MCVAKLYDISPGTCIYFRFNSKHVLTFPSVSYSSYTSHFAFPLFPHLITWSPPSYPILISLSFLFHCLRSYITFLSHCLSILLLALPFHLSFFCPPFFTLSSHSSSLLFLLCNLHGCLSLPPFPLNFFLPPSFSFLPLYFHTVFYFFSLLCLSELVEDRGFLDILHDLISDANPTVVSQLESVTYWVSLWAMFTNQ